MKEPRKVLNKKDLDNLQTALENIQKSDAKFVVISKEGDKKTLSLFEAIHINRIDKRYLVINLYYYDKNRSPSKQLNFISKAKGEHVDIDNILVNDIEIWSLNSFGIGEKVYPLE